MTTVSTIGEKSTEGGPQSSAGFRDRLLDWMNHVADAFFGPVVGEARHDKPTEAYLFLNPSCGGAIIDSNLWDLLTEQPPQPESEEASNV